MSEPFAPNPFDPAFVADPFPTYARGRREFPVFRHEGLPMISAFRFADIQPVLKDAHLWSSASPVGSREPEDASMLGQDPPRHTRLRNLVNQAFTPRRIRELEPRIRQVASDLVREAVAQGETDAVTALSIPLPVIMIGELIGVPADARGQFKAWSDALAADLGAGVAGSAVDPERVAQQESVRNEMRAFFSELAEQRRREPKDDLLTGLVKAELEGEMLSENEMHAMLSLLLIAGNETTTNLISNTLLQLDAHPDARRQLQADPSLVPDAIEEVLRFDGPVQGTFRTATADTEVGGEKIREGETVVTWLASANRDEAEFPDGESFDIRRDPNRHMTFGFGVHFCLGANLARMEGRVALETILAQTREFRRTDRSPVPRHPSFILRGPRKLDMRFDAA